MREPPIYLAEVGRLLRAAFRTMNGAGSNTGSETEGMMAREHLRRHLLGAAMYFDTLATDRKQPQPKARRKDALRCRQLAALLE